MKQLFPATVSINACVWPAIFGAVAIRTGQFDKILIYLAAGAIFGGVVLWMIAALWVLLRRAHSSGRFAREMTDETLTPTRLAIGALIPIVLGAVGIICETLRAGSS